MDLHEVRDEAGARGLIEPWALRGVRIRNRVMVSPMCTYAAGPDGLATDFHLVHLGRFALGGAGIVMVEATAIAPQARISHRDLGLWDDAQVPGLAQIATFLREHGAVPAIQLSHAGRKASCRAAWAGGAPLGPEDAEAGEPPWPTEAPSALSPGPGWQEPEAMTAERVVDSLGEWERAARRAAEAGFEVVEIHGAHGYLVHSFASPLSNRRQDEWGPGLAYPLAVVAAVRRGIGEERALFHRVSAVDGVDGGLELGDTVAFARAAAEAGVDLVDISSGGIVTDRRVDTRVRRQYGFHASFSHRVRREAGVPVSTVGLIVDHEQAQLVLDTGDADLVVVGREMLANPQWALEAEVAAGRGYGGWHKEAAWALEARDRQVEALAQAGETPLARYGR